MLRETPNSAKRRTAQNAEQRKTPNSVPNGDAAPPAVFAV
jgi:hypothetical protein